MDYAAHVTVSKRSIFVKWRYVDDQIINRNQSNFSTICNFATNNMYIITQHSNLNRFNTCVCIWSFTSIYLDSEGIIRGISSCPAAPPSERSSRTRGDFTVLRNACYPCTTIVEEKIIGCSSLVSTIPSAFYLVGITKASYWSRPQL